MQHVAGSIFSKAFSGVRSWYDSFLRSDGARRLRHWVCEGDTVVDIGMFGASLAPRFIGGLSVDLHRFEPKPLEPIADSNATRSRSDRQLITPVRPNDLAEEMANTPTSANERDDWLDAHAADGGDRAMSLDTYWSHRREVIHLLCVDAQEKSSDILLGAMDILRQGKVNFICFQVGADGEYWAGQLADIVAILEGHRYHLFEFKASRWRELTKVEERNERPRTLLAVNERLYSKFVGMKSRIGIYFDRTVACGVEFRGVIHVGAHNGDEIGQYRKMGVRKTLFVEANPEIAERLRGKFDDSPDVSVLEVAVSDTSGKAQFHLASNEESSSLMRPATHFTHYPDITFDTSIEVRTFRLDELLGTEDFDIADFNLLVMDIQGAELKALCGAAKLLDYIDAIQLEVQFEALYQDSPLIWDIDDMLAEKGFSRVYTNTPLHPTWGDALYLRCA